MILVEVQSVKLKLKLKDYIRQMSPFASDPLSLDKLLIPFGIYILTPESEDLLIGFVLDFLQEEKSGQDFIDPADVLDLAKEIGASGIDEFVDNFPAIIYQMSRPELSDF